MTPESDCCVIVFSKCPQHGSPKTRLQPPLSAREAALLHWRLTLRTLSMAAETAFPVQLWLDRDSSHPWVRAAIEQTGCSFHIQTPGDLGARMAHAFASALRNYDRVLLIGSDCAVMRAVDLQDADRALAAEADIALIPATDGGYVLIGARRLDARLFAGIDWGSNRVLTATRERLQDMQWSWHEGPTLWDVDRPEDLTKLEAENVILPVIESRA
ncbi:MAG: TIGR04282 family arsenosugar biosynthesis glycosyltransferase [Pseudomonadota bacterium]